MGISELKHLNCVPIHKIVECIIATAIISTDFDFGCLLGENSLNLQLL